MSLIKLTVKGISYSHSQNGAYALILDEVDGQRKLPIVIGAFEAQSIAIAIEEDIKPPRPLTHDLFKTFADRFDIMVKQILIHKLIDGVFFSTIICERDGVEEMLDARTSDAIALAIRFDAAIFTYRDIMEQAGIILGERDPEPTTEEDSENTSLVDPLIEDEMEEEDFSVFTQTQLSILLKEAIENEEYERAAKLRDELNKK
ncbi:bifunctional nuclease family protein [Myroides pelagicus]|uniref:BFN domain-containing protein n=1 Tax=Myroides pelagicus TaxID=270914 RepID=A0A7K1GML4_9FLAO|nr:bifunctional nuclease family protein [Myroides pelagicus]MEC4114411.1 bifunctional nuclease family protein [Myroides pelagicus]MTH30135.1 hypothetical protein [Myroides pelagicus]